MKKLSKTIVLSLLMMLFGAFALGLGYFLTTNTPKTEINLNNYSEEQINTAKLACSLGLGEFCSKNEVECNEIICEFNKKDKKCEPTWSEVEKFVYYWLDDCVKDLLKDEKPAKKAKKRELLAKNY